MDDNRVLLLICELNDLLLTIEVDARAHQDQRRVQCIFVAPRLSLDQVDEACADDFVLDALVLTFVVNAHVAEDAQAQLCHLRELVLELCVRIGVVAESIKQLVELFCGVTSQERFNSCVAKRDIDERFKQMDQVLRLLIDQIIRPRVLDERVDHVRGDPVLHEAHASILVHRHSVKGPCGCLTHLQILIFEQVL